MQAIVQHLHPRIARQIAVKYDADVRQHYYELYGERVYIERVRNFRKAAGIEWQCKNLYFKHYLPKPGDTVVDFGAGFGEEAVWLSQQDKYSSAPLRYIGVEVQPTVFNCLALTFARLGWGYEASPQVVSGRHFESFQVGSNYVSSGLAKSGQLRLPGMRWQMFVNEEFYNIGIIDLLKINIEGAELALLEEIGVGLKAVKRVIVSCHDFLGPATATKARVTALLMGAGYGVRTFKTGASWAGPDDWLYAERRTVN